MRRSGWGCWPNRPVPGWAALPLLLLCAGCQTTGSQQQVPAVTFDQARQVVLANRSRIWKDPDSVRDARIGQPYTCVGHLLTPGMLSDACICVEANARNSFGGYTGLQQSVVIIARGAVVDAIPARNFTDRCDGMVPFGELNGGAPGGGAVVRR